MASFEQRGAGIRATVRLPGGKKAQATFDTRAQAEAWARDIERRKSLGTLRSGVTAGNLFEAYLDAVASKSDSAKWNTLRIMKWLKDPLADKRLSDIVTHDVNEWISRRLTQPNEKTGKLPQSSTVNRELNLMSAAFTYAVADRGWIQVNPCHGCRRPPKGKARKPGLLTADEIMAVRIATGYESDPDLRTLTARVGACFLLALETGMRSGEILRLRPQDYWPERRTAHVAALEMGGRKSGQSGRASVDPSRHVPLTRTAMGILSALLASMPPDQPYIVGVSDRQRDALWRKALKQAGVEGHTFHDMKHEAATRLSKFLDVLALSHAIGTKDVKLLRDTYYVNDASAAAALLPDKLS